MKSKATGCGSISTVFSSIVLLCVSTIIIIIIIIINNNSSNNNIMKYQKTINLLDDTRNQPSKFRRRDWVEINDESTGRYNNRLDYIQNNHSKVTFMWL